MKHVVSNKMLSYLFLLFLVCMLVSCSSDYSDTTDSASPSISSTEQEPIELNFYVWTDELLYVTKAIDAFNAMHENIKVNVFALSNTNYEDALKAVLDDSSKQIDLFDTKGMAYIIQFVEENKVYNMTDYVKSSILNDTLEISAYGTMFNDILYKHQYYALPTRSTCWALYYNKDLFDNAGIPYPDHLTWSEYGTLAKKLTSGSGSSKVWGGYFTNWLPNFMAIQHGQYLTDDDQQYSRQSIELLNKFYRIDQSHVSYLDMQNSSDPSTDVYTQFEAGKVAMVPQGEWMVNILLSDQTTIDWDIAPMPVDDDVDQDTTIGQYQFISIASSCEHPDAAFEFVKFLSGKEGASIYAQNAIVPAYTDSDIISSYQAATNKESTKYFFQAKKYTEQIAIRGYMESISAFSTNAELYFSGQIALDEAMEAFETERNQIFH